MTKQWELNREEQGFAAEVGDQLNRFIGGMMQHGIEAHGLEGAKSLALICASVLQSVTVALISCGKPGVTGAEIVDQITEQVRVNLPQAEIAAAQVQRELGMSGTVQ